jgi:AmmeMemoRadiSam system protein A
LLRRSEHQAHKEKAGDVRAELTLDERQALLALARTGVGRAMGILLDAELPQHPVFDRRAGAFVTLHVAGLLRGCIGSPEATNRLGHVILHCAAAACEDPRFPRLGAHDVAALSIEVSVLSALARCAGPDDVVVGRHGVAVELGRSRGLLLPQVAAVRGWTATTFVEHACVKAGLPSDAWRNGAVICCFEADVFADAVGSHSLQL